MKTININPSPSRVDNYKSLLPQIRELLKDESDLIANLANIAAVLKTYLGFFWVGFYLVKQNELVLGPFQGSIACTRIQKGKGVCGTSWLEKKAIIVPDVNQFPGHIACSSASRSEIVIPVFNAQNEVHMVLDIDSDTLNDFSDVDQYYLEKILAFIPL